MKRKRRLIYLFLTLIALVLLIISRVLLAVPVERVALKAVVEERENKDIQEVTQGLTRTAEMIYQQVNQTLTALPLAETKRVTPGSPTPTEKNTLRPTLPSRTMRPSRTPTPEDIRSTATGNSPNRTPTSTLTAQPSQTSDLTSTTVSPNGNLPGLTPQIVTSFLANSLFECEDEQIDPLGVHYWTCSQSSVEHDILVTIYSRTANTVDMVEVITLPFTGPISHNSISKIALIASLPYINAEQQKAQGLDSGEYAWSGRRGNPGNGNQHWEMCHFY